MASTHSTLGRLLFRPKTFFETRTAHRRNSVLVVVLVAVGYFLIALGGSLVLGYLLSTMSAGAGTRDAMGMAGSIGFGQAVLSGLSVFLIWFLVSVILHVLVKLAHGSGTFGDTLTVVGWSAPVTLLLPMALTGTILAWTQMAPSPEVIVTSVDHLDATIRIVMFAIVPLVVVWQAAIWRAGLVFQHDVNGDTALGVTILTAFITLVAGLVMYG